MGLKNTETRLLKQLSLVLFVLLESSCSSKTVNRPTESIAKKNGENSPYQKTKSLNYDTQTKAQTPINFKLKNTVESKNTTYYFGLSPNDGLAIKSAYNGFKIFQFEAWANTGAIKNTSLDIGASFNVSDYFTIGTAFSNLADPISLTNNPDTKRLKKYDLSIGADLIKFYGKVDTSLKNEVEKVSVGVKGPLSIFRN